MVEATDGPCGLLGFEMHSDGAGHKSLNCDFVNVTDVSGAAHSWPGLAQLPAPISSSSEQGLETRLPTHTLRPASSLAFPIAC